MTDPRKVEPADNRIYKHRAVRKGRLQKKPPEAEQLHPAVVPFVPAGTASMENRGAALPKGFSRVSDASIFFTEEGGEPVWICSPIDVVAEARDRDSKGWSRLLVVTDADGVQHRWLCPMSVAVGEPTEVIRHLAHLGLRMNSTAQGKRQLMTLITSWPIRARALSVDRLGWAGDRSFLLGDGRVVGDQNVALQNVAIATAALEMRPSGSLQHWRNTVATPCITNPLLALGASIALAGPLLDLLGLDGGGFHLRGASSRGKTTVLRAAASVWGSPKLVGTWRATANGVEAAAAAASGTILILDEIGQVDAREAGQVAYLLANGAGKQRADRTGAARATATWRTLLLSSGEVSLADKIGEAGGRVAAGQQVRLLDIIADRQAHGAFDDTMGLEPAKFAEQLKAATGEAHGTAGPAFVELILRDLEGFKNRARRLMANFTAEVARQDDDGQVARAAQRLAVVAAAGELAAPITGWPEGTARAAAALAFQLWIDGRGHAGSYEAADAIRRVRAFLTAHGASRFERIGTDRPVSNRAGWVDQTDPTMFYIAKDAWKEIHRGSDPKRAAAHLAQAGWLMPGEGRNMMARSPRAVPERPRVYAVLASIMGAGDV